jgi:molybdopterin/thiamine biosynthesis adenylyltransferase/rhodanese-related sulfurtransferase
LTATPSKGVKSKNSVAILQIPLFLREGFRVRSISNNMTNFSDAEKRHYQRHFVLPNFGITGQTKLKNAAVLVIGAGGLGCPILQYLAAAGVGHLGIVDFDLISESNLQRQVLYSINDIGKPKVEIAKAKLAALNPHIKITTFQTDLNRTNVNEIFQDFEIIVDGTDNFDTRYLVNDACVLMNKTNIFGSVYQFEGQVAVFNYLQKDDTRSVNYRDLYPNPPEAGLIPNCAEGGVLGVLPGIIGTMQANEVIKVITNMGEPLINKIFIFEITSFQSYTLKIKKNPTVNINKLPFPQTPFCVVNTNEIKRISVVEFQQLKMKNEDFQLIDVREQSEYLAQNIGGLSLPLSNIINKIAEINKDKKVIIHCQSGKRSEQAITILQEKGFEHLWNLEGGIEAFLNAKTI